MERRLDSTVVFNGRLIQVRRDRVITPTGDPSTREIVEHPGAVAVLGATQDENVLLVEHYRYAVQRTMLEIPAGTREAGEPADRDRRQRASRRNRIRCDRARRDSTVLREPGLGDRGNHRISSGWTCLGGSWIRP